MKKVSVWGHTASCFCIGLPCSALLSGCYPPLYRGPQFSDEEEAQLIERGRELMEAHLPAGAEITAIKPDFKKHRFCRKKSKAATPMTARNMYSASIPRPG